MPTTRHRWQAESQSSRTSEREEGDPNRGGATKSPTAEKTSFASEQQEPALAGPDNAKAAIHSTSNALEDAEDVDINPRSPKRQRLFGPEATREEEQSAGPLIPAASSTQVPLSSSANASSVPLLPAPPQTLSSATTEGQGGGVNAAKPPPAGPSQQTRLDNLSILSNLASQLLSCLAKMSPTEALQLSRTQTTQSAREYHFIRSLFNPVRDLYLTGQPFLSPTRLNLTESDQVEILRKANQAMYTSSIFTGEIGLRDMDQNFLEVFIPEQGKLLKAQGSIHLELKTQAFITANRTGAAQPLLVMEELFPPDLESKILARRPGMDSLAPSEQDFLKRMSSRRDILLADVRNKTVDQLYLRYRWEDLSREVSAYLARNFGPAAVVSPEHAQLNTPQPSAVIAGQPQSHLQGEFSIHEPPMPMPTPSNLTSRSMPSHHELPSFLGMDDFVAQAARAAEIAMQGPAPPVEAPQPPIPPTPEAPKQTKVEPQFQHYSPAPTNSSMSKPSPFPPGQDEIPHVSQTAPTHVLYERARQAVTAKASPKDKKPPAPSQRRPWTPEEEAAIMTGLDQVKGPHWSQILAMYGPGGTINESLKDRNQVQLKDKARNLKLFFLKAGIEVPYYLQYVTGDLKTRAPGQAEKQERERLQSDGYRTHYDGLQGLMGLATDAGQGEGIEGPEISPIDPEDTYEELTEAVSDPAAVAAMPREMDIEAMIARAAAEASASYPTS